VVRYTIYCYLFHVRPANRLTIPDVALCHKKAGDPWSTLLFATVTRWRHCTVSSCSRLDPNEKLPGLSGFPTTARRKFQQPCLEKNSSPRPCILLSYSYCISFTTLYCNPHMFNAFRLLTNNKMLPLYNRTNEPTDRFNYKNSYTRSLLKPRNVLYFGLYFPLIFTNDCP
jgi:hypothetical protein